MPPIDLRTLWKESVVIGAILVGSYALGAVLNVVSEVGFLARAGDLLRMGVVTAGTSVAVLYVVVRAAGLARRIAPVETDFEGFGREAVVLAVPVVVWFALAGLVTVLLGFDPVNAAVETLVAAFTRTGILIAALYLLARTIATVRSPEPAQGTVPGDD